MNTHLPKVAIFDADEPPALAFLRSLGRVGAPVCVYSHRRFPVARFSRYCRGFGACPDPADAARFLPWLRAQLAAGAFDLIAPTSDLQAFYLSEVHELIAPELRARLTAPERVRDCLFKDSFDRRCRAEGVGVPEAHLPESVEEARAIASALRYPCILKPRSHVGVGLERGCVVHDPAELIARFAPYAIAEEHREIVERYPSLRLPMIQEYVPGALENLVSVSGALGVRGEVLAATATRKTLQWPPTLGIGIEFESVEDPALVERGVAVARALLGSGIFELELILDRRSGEWLAIDLNPRGHGFMALDIARGADLPALWYHTVIGEPVSPRNPRNDLRWTHAVPLHARQLARLARGPNRLDELRRWLDGGRRSVDVVHDPDDPAPTVRFAARMLRHPGGLVRPFLAPEGEDAR
jgi:D-aspartate ligase